MNTNQGTITTKATHKSKAKASPAPLTNVSFKTCVRTIKNLTVSRRGLLHLELAVGLAVFIDKSAANLEAKRVLARIYAEAGYACEPGEGDYKTINRRIQAVAALYTKLGDEVLNHWLDNVQPGKMLQVLAQKVGELDFKVLDDVLDYVGKPSNRTRPEAGEGNSLDIFDIVVGERHIHLPKTMTPQELVELGNKILALAKGMEKG